MSVFQGKVRASACRDVLQHSILRIAMPFDLRTTEVKRFTPDYERYIVGDINGNVKCILRSKGMKATKSNDSSFAQAIG